jgi:hypothetical protein
MHRIPIIWRIFSVVQFAGMAGLYLTSVKSPWILIWAFVLAPGSLVATFVLPLFYPYFDPGWQLTTLYMLIAIVTNFVTWFAVFRVFRALRKRVRSNHALQPTTGRGDG